MSALEAFSIKKNALKNKLKIYESFFCLMKRATDVYGLVDDKKIKPWQR